MAEKEQVQPLSPLDCQPRSDVERDYEALSKQMKFREKRFLLCCGCVTALFLIVAVVFIVLAFTVLHIKKPTIHMISVSVQDLNLTNGTLASSANITVLATLSVKNPNVASYEFSGSTTTLYYAGTVVGKGIGPPGRAKARRTEIMNITAYVMAEKMSGVTRFQRDLKLLALNISSQTVVTGKVKIIARKEVTVEMSCGMTYNISRQAIEDDHCDSDIHF